MNEMQEDMGAHSAGADDDVDGFLVGATSIVWEEELYTYGGLAPEAGGLLRTSTRTEIEHELLGTFRVNAHSYERRRRRRRLVNVGRVLVLK